MITLFAAWEPGPLTPLILLIVLIILTAFVVKAVVIRWIFRINKRIELLTQIKDELKKLNMRG